MEDSPNEKVSRFVDRCLLVIDSSSFAAEAAKLMKKHSATSLLVSEGKSKNPVGIITEKDILYKIVADGKGPYKVTVGEIMSHPLITIDENATVREAMSIMRSKSIRRMPVVSDDRVIGMVNFQTMVGKEEGGNTLAK